MRDTPSLQCIWSNGPQISSDGWSLSRCFFPQLLLISNAVLAVLSFLEKLIDFSLYLNTCYSWLPETLTSATFVRSPLTSHFDFVKFPVAHTNIIILNSYSVLNSQMFTFFAHKKRITVPCSFEHLIAGAVVFNAWQYYRCFKDDGRK